MLYEFTTTSSDCHITIQIFKATSKIEVAEHILDNIRLERNSGYLNGMGSINIGCCGYGDKLELEYDNYEGKLIELRKYLLTLSADEFLKVLDMSHPHSGGDIDQISITEYNIRDIIDLT
jgi:hypothetical protein